VEVLNAFHGYDYGFEVNIYNTAHPSYPDGKMIYHKLKESQDSSFSFVLEGAKVLRTQLASTIKGINHGNSMSLR
jgi:hypothetical protein